MGVRLLPRPAVQAIRRWSSAGAAKQKSRVSVEPLSLTEKIAPFAFILGVSGSYLGTRQNLTSLNGSGWIGEVWRIYGKIFVYRRPIKDQIREQKMKELKEFKDWPWRIWFS